jgi:hypothetical protein
MGVGRGWFTLNYSICGYFSMGLFRAIGVLSRSSLAHLILRIRRRVFEVIISDIVE